MQKWKSDIHTFVGKTFDASYGVNMNKYPVLSLFSKENINSPVWEMRDTGDYSLMQEYDGVNLSGVDESRGFISIIKPKEYSLYEDITMKRAKLDKLGESKKVGQKLARSAVLTKLKLALDIFSNAFDAKVLGSDGVSWANSKHPLASSGDENPGDALKRKSIADKSKGTYSNFLKKEFSIESIGEAQTLGSKILAPNESPTGLTYDLVLVSPELEVEAKKIFGVGSKYKPELNPNGTANNQANPVSDLRYVVCGAGNWGLQGKQWALCDSTAIRDVLKEIVISEPMIKQTQLDNPLINREVAYMDLGYGFGDARPIIFCDPEKDL